ncbi:MAG TPA: DUF309 domain-containing protein [Methylomirabilota bacterium]|nr:DUF309 domain-containing protein [Methylomirabilota bacterium]
MIPTAPLRVRNRLAQTILAALHDSDARRTLATLAAAPETWLAADEAPWAAPLAARARRASEALAAWPRAPRGGGLPQALAAAAVLFDAGLFFETHEVLEPHWATASGDTREALQGLIQVAVGYQHLANGNLAGAAALLAEGAARLRGRRLAGADLDPLARAAAEGAAGLPDPVPSPRFPDWRPGGAAPLPPATPHRLTAS